MNLLDKGYFITLEGIDGAGKTSHASFIKEQLEKVGRKVLLTREPGGTELGDAIRQLLLDASRIEISKKAQLLLLFAARLQHVKDVITPALKDRKIVLCDRFTDSSYAYQGGEHGLAIHKIQQLEQWVFEDITLATKPDLTLLLDISTEATKNRRQQVNLFSDRFEFQNSAFYQSVRKTFLDIAQREPDRVIVINATKPLINVQSKILSILTDKGLLCPLKK